METAPLDAGMRAWYVSCRCCLSDAHPEVAAALDQERAVNGEGVPTAGICEVADAASQRAAADDGEADDGE